uniref:Uncharacterized protein n=1 Tax=Plectus sambesii TaxID=2011161 RepID=A0A914V6Z9_9BILA
MADSRHTSVSSSLERNHSAHQKSLQFSNHPKTIPEVEPVREQHGDVKRVGFPASLDRGVDDETTANRGRQSATNGRNDEFEYHKYDFIEQERADDGRRYGSSSFVQDFQPEKSESRTGRFVKKSAAAIIARKQTSSVNTNVNVVNLNGSTSPPKRMPVQENKKANGQNGDGNKAVGESRIAAEIRNLREREDELRRSRS